MGMIGNNNCDVFAVGVAKKAWKVLRQQFKVHFDKLPPRRSGDPAPEDTVEWPYFKSLLFLKDIFEKRPSSGNLCEVEQETEDDGTNTDEDDTQNEDIEGETDDIISSPPTPSSQTSSVGRSSAGQSSSTRATDTTEKRDTLGYRKRLAPMDLIGKGLLDIEKEKLKMKKSKQMSAMDKDDEDVAFFTSILPHVKKLRPAEKLNFRIKVQQWLMEIIYEEKNTRASNQIPSTSHAQHQEVTFDGNRSYTVMQSLESPNEFIYGNTNY